MDSQVKNLIRNNYDNEDYYEHVMSQCDWNLTNVKDKIDCINVQYFVKQCKNLSTDVVSFLIKDTYITLEDIISHQQLPDSFIENIFNKGESIMIKECLEHQRINSRLLQKHKDILNWELVSGNQYMDLQFLFENIKDIKWELLPFNYAMRPYINEGIISLFYQTTIWDNIGYTDIDMETLIKYKKNFTDKSYESLLECRDISKDQIDNMSNN